MTTRRVTLLKVVVWAACLAPFVQLVMRTFTGGLGANPIEHVTHFTGYVALVILLITLAVTPLRRVTHLNELVKFRRLIGLFAFFYALLHFLTYLVADQFFDWSAIAADILKRPYITVGFIALVILTVLALTSPRAMVRRLGRRWQTVHRFIYPAAALGVLHFYWKRSSKNDLFEPIVFAIILAVLLAARIPAWREQWQRRHSRRL